MSERGPFYVEVMRVPDRSKYHFPPYWWPDTPIPELTPDSTDPTATAAGDEGRAV